MEETDAVGTTGSADHGGMLRMWLKFTEKDGRLVIDRDSFQPFGGQTAIDLSQSLARAGVPILGFWVIIQNLPHYQ